MVFELIDDAIATALATLGVAVGGSCFKGNITCASNLIPRRFARLKLLNNRRDVGADAAVSFGKLSEVTVEAGCE